MVQPTGSEIDAWLSHPIPELTHARVNRLRNRRMLTPTDPGIDAMVEPSDPEIDACPGQPTLK